MTLLASEVDVLAQKLDSIDISPALRGSSNSSTGAYTMYETYGKQGHTSIEWYNDLSIIEHANVEHSFNPSSQKSQNNPYSKTYNHG